MGWTPRQATLKEALQDRIPGVHFHTPLDPELSGGVVVFAPPGLDIRKTYQKLYQEHRIGCTMFSGEFEGIRICPHIYNTMDEIHRAVEAIGAYV